MGKILDYCEADQNLRKHKKLKMEIAHKLHGVGFHEAIGIMYSAGQGPVCITKRFNSIAERQIVAVPTICSALGRIGVYGVELKDTDKKTKPCSCCGIKFTITLKNRMLCGDCRKKSDGAFFGACRPNGYFTG